MMPSKCQIRSVGCRGILGYGGQREALDGAGSGPGFPSSKPASQSIVSKLTSWNKTFRQVLKIAAKTQAEGKAALAERDRRRRGLGLSAGFILIVLLGLRLYIRQIESNSGNGGTAALHG